MSNELTSDEAWMREEQLSNQGWELSRRDGVLPHTGAETAKHWFVKCAVARVVDERGEYWATEVRHQDRGICDVLVFGESDGKPYIVEIETGLTDRTKREKAKRYAGGERELVRDVLFIDPEDAPENVLALEEWVAEQLFGGIE